jgi:hypothetical protein
MINFGEIEVTFDIVNDCTTSDIIKNDVENQGNYEVKKSYK